MEKRTYNVYKYDELTDEQKDKVIEKYYDINTDYEWWDHYGADDSGIKLKEFDIDRGSYCKLGFEVSEVETARAIVKNHGESCETYVTSADFLKKYEPLAKEYDNLDINESDEVYELAQALEDEMEEFKDEYVDDLQNDYLKMLRKEYEYITSREAIEEAIRANDYDFTEDGIID